MSRRPEAPRSWGAESSEEVERALDLHALLEDLYPADIFDMVVMAESHGLPPWFAEHFEVVAMPGEPAIHARPGDAIVQRGLGEGRLAWAWILGEGDSPPETARDRILLRDRGGDRGGHRGGGVFD